MPTIATRLASRRGFSLVELLVVMLIISVLLAFLLPALTKWRETTRKTWCRTNLHQIGIAMHSYQTDFKGVAVMSGRHPFQWGNGAGWADRRYATADELWHKEYMTDLSAMRCPSIFEHGHPGKPTLFVDYPDEEMFGTNYRFEDTGARQAFGADSEYTPYWLFGVSLGLVGFNGSPGTIYWVKPELYEDTLQVQVQDAVVSAEPVETGHGFERQDQSNHAVRVNLNLPGVPSETWRGEGGNALRVDGSVDWYALPRTPKIRLTPHASSRDVGTNVVDNDWVNMGLHAAGGGNGSVARLMIPGSSSLADWGTTKYFRGDRGVFWKTKPMFPGAGVMVSDENAPLVGFYDRRPLNWND